tara:strand:+ start:313 stop:501 length:189 start_codon:yes stop_codon:yes gene_type:complete
MYFTFRSFACILIGVVFLGISLGIVLGAYLKKNALDSYIYIAAFLASIGSAMIILGAFKKDD